MKKVLLTGAGGFVGSHVLRHILENTDWEIFCPVTFRHRGNSDRIKLAMSGLHNDALVADKRVTVFFWDMRAPMPRTMVLNMRHMDYVLNVASESHVDRSISNPVPFVRNNVDVMLNLLELCREIEPEKILHMSTDEVYGPAPQGHNHVEWETPLPSNPYSGSKAAQEAIAISYWRTYNIPLMITNTMNIIGETQDKEKFVAKTMRSLLHGEPVEVHVSQSGVSGSRFYLHARNLADAWLHLLKPENNYLWRRYSDGFDRPERFNIVGEREVTNIEMVALIAHLMEIENYTLDQVDFHSTRPGHDMRYALDGSKLALTGWRAPITLDESLQKTIQWTLAHPEWLI